MAIYANGKDFTTEFYGDENFTEYLDGLVVRRKANLTFSASFSETGNNLEYKNY